MRSSRKDNDRRLTGELPPYFGFRRRTLIFLWIETVQTSGQNASRYRTRGEEMVIPFKVSNTTLKERQTWTATSNKQETIIYFCSVRVVLTVKVVARRMYFTFKVFRRSPLPCYAVHLRASCSRTSAASMTLSLPYFNVSSSGSWCCRTQYDTTMYSNYSTTEQQQLPSGTAIGRHWHKF